MKNWEKYAVFFKINYHNMKFQEPACQISFEDIVN